MESCNFTIMTIGTSIWRSSNNILSIISNNITRETFVTIKKVQSNIQNAILQNLIKF